MLDESRRRSGEEKGEMNRVLLVGLFFVTIATGCGKDGSDVAAVHVPSSGSRQMIAKVDEMGRQLMTINDCPARFPIMEEVRRAVGEVTNLSERVAVLDQLTDHLFALDFSGLNYRTQSRALHVIKLLVEGDVLLKMSPRFPLDGEYRDRHFEWEYDMRLKYLAWCKAQIVRTAPKNRLKNPDESLSEEQEEEMKCWRSIHYSGIENYESSLESMEMLFPYQKRQMSEEAWNRIKGKIENYLGRPIRTKQQLKDDFKAKRNVEFFEKEDPRAAP